MKVEKSMNNNEIWSHLKAIDAGAELDERVVIALLLDGCDVEYSGYNAADNLISRYGTLNDICDISSKVLSEVPGVGLEGARLLKACRAAVYSIFRNNSTDEMPRLFTQEELVEHLRPDFIGVDSEYCFVYLLNERYRLVHSELVGRGNFEEVPFNFNRVLKLIGRYDARRIIIAHNHKASVFPSETDIVITNKLCKLLFSIDVVLVDHMIFCENNYKSMRASGYIEYPQDPELRKLFPK